MTHSGAPSKDRTGRRSSASAEFAERAAALLTTREVGHALRAFDVVESTNTTAASWIDEGAPHGAVVAAEYQSRGRGRLGRSWSAQRGLNLTFSVILRPELPPDRIGMLTIAACVGVAAAVDRFVNPLRCVVKWPNDLLLNDRKMCGMLLEASWSTPGRNPAVVLGIGLNVNQDNFSDDIQERATSLLIETGRIIPRDELFASILGSLEASLESLENDEETLRQKYLDRMLSLDETITLRFAGTERTVSGIVRGIDASGGIIIEADDGRHVFHAGEVTRSA